MKRLCLIGFTFFLLVACKNDDDQIMDECKTPTNLSVTQITDVSAILNWENSNDYSEIKIEYGEVGFLPGEGTILTTSQNSISINDLFPNTNYDFYVQALCSIENISIESVINSFITDVSPVIPEFLPTLSEMNLFTGNIAELNISPKAFLYEISTPLHTDYAHKQRVISLPSGTSMEYQDDGLPIFPDGSLIAKTFYYNHDETNLDLGRKIIETRILIKQSNVWHIGNYLWNENQTDAVLDEDEHIVPISWINEFGEEMTTNYEVPNYLSCVMCHQNNGNRTPIGPKIRSMNFDVNGSNQLTEFTNKNYLINTPDPSSISSLPNWNDTSYSDEERTKAYFDMNCAHCHSPGGFHNNNYSGNMDFRLETSFEDSQIYENRFSIRTRFPSSIPGYSMPYIGVTIPHQEAIDLIIPYLETLE